MLKLLTQISKLCLLFVLFLMSSKTPAKSNYPNIIFIFADDMGIGDVSHNKGKVATPNIDRLVKEGLRFTDAHTTSSVCTPSRYSLMTGRYCWRTSLEKGVIKLATAPPLIKENETTVASLLKRKGYHTACVGKWHLGMGWQEDPNYQPKEEHQGEFWNLDYTKSGATPVSRGFDYFFGMNASMDIPPFVYIENDRFTQQPTVSKKTRNRLGAAGADFDEEKCLQVFAEKSVNYIKERKSKKDPFFLYLALTSPHLPFIPSSQWKGKSGLGNYGDYIMETDWVVGEILKALDQHQLNKNTLVIFSADNGPTFFVKKETELLASGHRSNNELRGYKGDIYEGGHRVPFIVRWPAVVKANTQTTRLTSMADFIATCAEITEQKLKDNEAVDAISFLTTLKDPAYVADRQEMVFHSLHGAYGIRKGNWKLALTPGSGGWTKGRRNGGKVQLYDLSNDISETKNLHEENPDKVQELTSLLQKYVDEGRSTQGKPQQNDRVVTIYPSKSVK